MREGRRSTTSDGVAALRALYTQGPPQLAVLDDPAARGLLPAHYRLLLSALNRVPGASGWFERALNRVTMGLTAGVPLRTAAIDDAVRRSVEEGTRQLVLLGAGLDARAWRLPELAGCHVFELDHPATQTYKRARQPEFSPLCKEISFVPIDFEHQTIAEVLTPAGFRSDAPSIWIWEGVTMYLTQTAVEGTLSAVAELSASGSRLALTYLPPEYGPRWVQALSSGSARIVGEALRAELAPDWLAERLTQHDYTVESDDSAIEWAERYWPKSEWSRVRPWERLGIALKR